MADELNVSLIIAVVSLIGSVIATGITGWVAIYAIRV